MKSPAKKLFVVLSVALPLAFAVALTSHAEEGSNSTSTSSSSSSSSKPATSNSEALCSGEDKAVVKQKCAAQNGDLHVTKTSAGCYDVQCVTRPPAPAPLPMCAGATDDITCATGTHRERVKTANNCFDVKCVPFTPTQTNTEKPMTKPPLKTTEDGDVITFTCKGFRSTGKVECDINGKSFTFNMNDVRKMNMDTKTTPAVKPKAVLNDKCMAIAKKVNALAGAEKNEDGTVSPGLAALRKEYVACRTNGVVRGSTEPVESDRNARLMKDGNCWYKVNDKTGTKEQVSCGEKSNTVTVPVKPTSSSATAQ